jgi:hypothetical protein
MAAPARFFGSFAVALLLGGLALSTGAPRAIAITINPAEAPMALLTPAPHEGAGGGVIDADTAGGPAQSTGPSPVILLIAALGVLVGVLLITRPRRRGPD